MRRRPKVGADGAIRAMIGGTWWSIARLLLSVLVLSAIVFALLGYATLAAHLHNAIFSTALHDRHRRSWRIAWSAIFWRKPPRPTRRPAAGCATASAWRPIRPCAASIW